MQNLKEVKDDNIVQIKILKKKQKIEQVIASPPENSVVLSFDEKGKTSIKKYGGQKYTFSGYYQSLMDKKLKVFVIYLVPEMFTTIKDIIGFTIGKIVLL